jgi:hypothetical protein
LNRAAGLRSCLANIPNAKVKAWNSMRRRISTSDGAGGRLYADGVYARYPNGGYSIVNAGIG